MIYDQTPQEFNVATWRDLQRMREEIHRGMAETRKTTRESLRLAYETLWLADSVLGGMRRGYRHPEHLEASILGRGE